MEKTRLYELDLVRSLACVMIVVMHAPMPVEGNATLIQTLVMVGTGYICASGIGLFFMVSGALLLPIAGREDALMFVKHRL